MFDAITSALSGIANALGFAYLAAIFIGAILVALLITILITRMSYETKLLKAIDGFNAYLRSKPYVGDDNLIEFNNRMKAAPGVLRNRWQMFVLNREDGIAKYINLDSCVEKPLRTGTIDRVIKNFTAIAVFLAFVSAALSAALVAEPGLSLAQVLFRVLAIPAIIVLVAVIGVIVVRSLKGAVQSDLYEYFHIFENNITRAVTTLPPYVDYEILFTRKEIRDSIPVLQQYLEKRAVIEQEELEKARKNAIEVEGYNFDELGLNGALVLERAMRECEVYLGTKRRLKLECDQIETERANYEKNYEITSKDYQRKLQISRENLESLKKQQESSTNRIESNYIKKQQADEIKKQQQIEKDADAAALKFKEEQEALKTEITKRQDEIETHRVQIEDAMKLEFKNYARLMFAKLQEIAVEKMGSDYNKLIDDNKKLRGIVKRAKSGGGIVEMETVADELEEEEREKEAMEGKRIPEFISKGFDLSAETNFDPPVVKPKPEQPKAEEFRPEVAQAPKPTVFSEPERETLQKFDHDKSADDFRPSIKTDTDSSEKLSDDDFKTPEFKFEPEEDFKPTIKIVNESEPKKTTDDDIDAGRTKQISEGSEDFSSLYDQIYDQMKVESDTAEGKTSEKEAISNEKFKQDDDTLLSVSQKLQEENKRLREQKAALDSEINATISRISDKAPKQSKDEPIDDVQFMLDSMKENLKKQQSAEPAKSAAKTATKAAGAGVVAKPVSRPTASRTSATRPAARTASKPAASARPATRPASASSRPVASRPLPRKTTSSGTGARNTRPSTTRRRVSQIDEGHSVDDIAGEMDKLINSNKKK
ncbi:MAG: hypothetical protein LBN07_01390 [Christensenellaceae bacterium]|jgi:hypothetical protein|nr:hypothetical protein [Christensenellaceae bacterium]